MKKSKLIEVEEYSLLAVYTANNESKMAWLLNDKLNVDLQREAETLLHNDKGEPAISLYSDRNTFKPIYFVMIANMFELKTRFADYHQINYFLKITGATQIQTNTFIANIKTIDGVIACVAISNIPKLKKYFDRL